MPYGRIDVHTHFFAATLVDALAQRQDLPKITGTNGDRLIHYGAGNIHPLEPRMTDLEGQLQDMEENGIDLALLSTNVPGVDWFPPADGVVVAHDVNDELIDITRAHPDRLAALAALPLQAPEEAAAELERAVALGLKGAMVYSNAAGRGLDEPDLHVVWDVAARLDVPILIHPTYPLSAPVLDVYALIPTVGFLVDTTTAVLRLIFDGLYERHPDFKLVVCHTGSLMPQLAGRIDYEASRHAHVNGLGKLEALPSERIRQVYSDVVCVWPPAVRSALELHGADHLMFGSDYPFWDPQRTIATLADVELPDADRAAIGAGTAQRVYGLGG
jgi:predicted TIM-barrel fold metal-dependent hydrolase